MYLQFNYLAPPYPDANAWRLSAMETEKLRAHLEQLHAELKQIRAVNEADRELLGKLARDVQEILDQGDTNTPAASGLGERLREAIARMESSHPKITLLMREVIDQLAFLGI